MHLPTVQTSAPIDTKAQTNTIKTPSVSMSGRTFPNQQELPALDPDFGGSSESSLFEPTPEATPQNDQQVELEAGIFNQDLDGFVALEGAWDPSQGSRKYRTLAPKPPTPRPEQLPPNDQHQRPSCTQFDLLRQYSAPGRNAILPCRTLRSASRVLSSGAASNISDADVQHRHQAAPIAGALLGDSKPQQRLHSDAVTGLPYLSPDPMVVQFLQQPGFAPSYGCASLVANQNGQTRLPPPGGPSSGVGSDFDAFFDNSAPDNFPTSFAQPAYPDFEFPILQTNETEPPEFGSFKQTTMPPASDPFSWAPFPTSLPNDNAPDEEEPQLDRFNQNHGTYTSSMPPTMSLTLPSEDTIGTNPLSPHHMHAPSDSVAPSFPTLQDVFLEGNPLQQSWHPPQDKPMPNTTYRNSYDAAYPPLEDDDDDDEPAPSFHNYSTTPDNFDFSSSPLYSQSSGTRNPSLPTTPHRTDDRGARDTSMDGVLLAARAQGMTYKEIRDHYGFSEAESTLRGRYRTLTKPKDERVRKPTWNHKAVSTLLAAVHSYAEANSLNLEFVWIGDEPFLKNEEDLKKIGWKKVAELIHAEGCYLYGNSTTKEKYKELRKAALARLGLEE